MKKFSIIAVALSLSACAGLPAAVSAVSSAVSAITPAAASGSNRVILEGTRGLVLAHNAYQGAAAALVPVVNSGRLSREQLLRLRDIDNQVFVLLQAGNGVKTQAQRAAEILNLVDELNRMAGK